MKKNSLLLILLIIGVRVFGQQTWQTTYNLTTGSNQFITKKFTAISFQIPLDINPSEVELKIGERKVALIKDEHTDITNCWQSVIQVFTDSVFTIHTLRPFNIKGFFQNISSIKTTHGTFNLRENNCEMPTMIPPSVWRVGLDNPKPNPISTSTLHGIIHHSASGNGQTNYTDLVRSYYVHHTQVNGWDDIGYNFLIAYDGTIYIGRDKQQLNVPQYQVKGAHFCNKNVGTFGVCLIGNFSDLSPSDTMLKSLQKLMTWVLNMENLSAVGSSPHPTPNDANLSNIAGHRQGCSTECPGDSTFLIIQDIRDSVENARLYCVQYLKVKEIIQYPLKYSLNDNLLQIENLQSNIIEIYNLSGQLINTVSSNEGIVKLDVTMLNSGIYIAVAPQQGFIRFLKE